MMISTKLSLQNLALVLVVFTVFTVSLTETIQVSDALSVAADRLVFELDVGETQALQWGVRNDNAFPIDVEFYATGPGSELMVFEEIVSFETGERKMLDIFVVVPNNHQDDIEFHPILHALHKSTSNISGNEETLGSKASVNVVMKSTPWIKIGDNPIYTPPKVEKKVVEEENRALEPPKTIEEKEKVPTLAEKLAKIQAANEANTPVMGETPAQATGQFEVEDPVLDYVPEPGMDADLRTEINPVGTFSEEEEGGGCLIATATFGSEMAPQVQLLREIRDNQLMGTDSGMAFMSGFNSLYYSFSPVIADMERENPAFKELVKLTITPMISTLSVMEYADSDDKVLGLGIGVILMNLGMYVGLPTFGIVKLIQFRKN